MGSVAMRSATVFLDWQKDDNYIELLVNNPVRDTY